MHYWLMKTEPDVFSFDDLVRAPKRTTCWEGVRNYQARNFMRDDFRVGDRVLIYHSNIPEAGVYGIAEVARAGYPDLTALDPKSKYHDPKAKGEQSPWIMVDVKATERLKRPVTRERLQSSPGLKEMMVLRKGSRLSVQPVTKAEFDIVRRLGEPEPV